MVQYRERKHLSFDKSVARRNSGRLRSPYCTAIVSVVPIFMLPDLE